MVIDTHMTSNKQIQAHLHFWMPQGQTIHKHCWDAEVCIFVVDQRELLAAGQSDVMGGSCGSRGKLQTVLFPLKHNP